jgi:hypothetical protein
VLNTNPDTSGNPFQRAPVTQYRISFNGKPVPLPGAGKSRAPWWEVRVLTGAPRPALLLMETGAYLLTETDGRPHLEELAPRLSSHTEWQWLDSEAGQPGPKNIVGLAHRPGQPLELSGGRPHRQARRALIRSSSAKDRPRTGYRRRS